ncbi:MAG: HDOD domain-containing protein [Pseudomonadota bacterium]
MSVPTELQEKLDRLSDLPSPPKVAMALVELARDPDVTVGAIADVIEFDPALSAKVLRVANSAHYVRSKACETVRRALITLGLQSTISTALSFSLVNSLRQKRAGELNYNRYWQRSIMAGIAARELGEQAGFRDKESLFLAALLQDIGMLAVDTLDPYAYSAFTGDVSRHADIEAFERDQFGCCHTEIGAWLLSRWRLPEQFALAVDASHDPTRLEADHEWATYARCVALAGLFADVWFTNQTPAAFAELVDRCEDALDMAPADTGIALARMRERAPETAGMFDVQLLSQTQMQQVVNDAKQIILANNAAALAEASKLREALASYQTRAARV